MTFVLSNKSTNGVYDGNTTVNRAIPHGLGCVPNIIFLVRPGIDGGIAILIEGVISFVLDSNSNNLSVTQPDSTNFYVGNASSYGETMNLTTHQVKWVAFT